MDERQQQWEECRQRCFEQGYRPGSAAWQRCVHGWLGMNREESIPDQWLRYLRPALDELLSPTREASEADELIKHAIDKGIHIGRGGSPEEETDFRKE